MHIPTARVLGASQGCGPAGRGYPPVACCTAEAVIWEAHATHSLYAWWHLNHHPRRWSYLFLVPAAEVEKKKANFCMWFSFDKDAECYNLILFAILNCSLSGVITQIVPLNIYSWQIFWVYGMQIKHEPCMEYKIMLRSASSIRWNDELHMLLSCNLSCVLLNDKWNGIPTPFVVTPARQFC